MPAKYNLAIVEAIILEMAAELNPRHLKTKELCARIITNPKDAREIETVVHAIRNLREFGLFSNSNVDLVKATPAGLHAVKLLA